MNQVTWFFAFRPRMASRQLTDDKQEEGGKIIYNQESPFLKTPLPTQPRERVS
jgi:hypothetical protein